MEVNRRTFLLLSGLGLSAAALGALAYDVSSLKNEVDWQKCAHEFLSANPSLTPYSAMEGRLPVMGTEHLVRALSPRPAVDASYALTLADGATPSFRINNDKGVTVYTGKPGSFDDPAVTSHLFNDENPSRLLLMPGKHELQRNGRPIKNILISGDSWTEWNGVEASVAAWLQRLCTFSNLNIQVAEIGVSGTNIANTILQVSRLHQNGFDPDMVISTFHAQTDPTFDMGVLIQPISIQEKMLTTNASAVEQHLNYMRVVSEQMARSGIGSFLKNAFRSGRVERDMRIVTNPDGLVADAGPLAAVSDKGKPLFDAYLGLYSYFLESTNSEVLMAYMPPLLTDDSLRLYRSGMVHPIDNLGKKHINGYSSTYQDNYPPWEIDAYSHPTHEGSLTIATDLFTTITGLKPSDEVLKNARHHYDFVHAVSDAARMRMK